MTDFLSMAKGQNYVWFPDINTHVRGEQKIKKNHRLKNEKYTMEEKVWSVFFP